MDLLAVKNLLEANGKLRRIADINVEWGWDLGAVYLESGTPKHEPGARRILSLVFQYWAIVVPLAMLAAWLLFSKPTRLKPTTESAP
jgi:hypothetical protein